MTLKYFLKQLPSCFDTLAKNIQMVKQMCQSIRKDFLLLSCKVVSLQSSEGFMNFSDFICLLELMIQKFSDADKLSVTVTRADGADFKDLSVKINVIFRTGGDLF